MYLETKKNLVFYALVSISIKTNFTH